MGNTDRIAAALADLESRVGPNYSATAKKHGVVRTILMRRFIGKTVSNPKATINIAKKKVLVAHIQRLVARDTPPTPVLVRNFTEKIHESRLGKNWTTRFIQRHSIHLKTLYLCAI